MRGGEAWVGLSSAAMDEADHQAGTQGSENGDSAVSEEERDHRATEGPQRGSDPEPDPGQDPGPMGNPAEDEEALRHQQEDSSGSGA